MDSNKDVKTVEEQVNESEAESSDSWESIESSSEEEQEINSDEEEEEEDEEEHEILSDGDHPSELNYKSTQKELGEGDDDNPAGCADCASLVGSTKTTKTTSSWESIESSRSEESCSEYTTSVEEKPKKLQIQKRVYHIEGDSSTTVSRSTSWASLSSYFEEERKENLRPNLDTQNFVEISGSELPDDTEFYESTGTSSTSSGSWETTYSKSEVLSVKSHISYNDDDDMDDLQDDDYDYMDQAVIVSDYFPYTEQVWRSKDGERVEVYNGECTTFRELEELILEEANSDDESEPLEKYNPEFPEDVPPKTEIINFTEFLHLQIMKCPFNSLAEINIFPNLVELVICNTDDIKEILWSQLEMLQNLETLFLSKTYTTKIEPLHFPKLTKLTIIKNQLTSVDFLTEDLVNLKYLNLAMNDISHIAENAFFTKGKLKALNLSGNLLCLKNDIGAIKGCKTLRRLKLSNAYNGTCPLSEINYSRLIFCHEFPNLITVNAEKIYPEDRQGAKDFQELHSNRYYSRGVAIGPYHLEYRQKSKKDFMQKLTQINSRLLRILNLNATFRRARGKPNVPNYVEVMDTMKSHLEKLENRKEQLKDWTFAVMKRLEFVTEISYWEEKVEKWGTWIEYDSYGSIQCQLSFSVLGELYDPPPQILTVIIQLLSSLSCLGAPSEAEMKVETIFSLSATSISKGMYNYHQKYVVQKEIPEFMGPAPLRLEDYFDVSEINVDAIFYNLHPSFFDQTQETYLPEDYQFKPAIFPFPDSITGCFEPPQPMFLFLMVPPEMNCTPLQYLHKFLTQTLRHSQNVRFTNCMWAAIANNIHHSELIAPTFAVLIVVKVVDDFLQIVETRKTCNKKGSTKECSIFRTTKSVCVTPAYVLGISISQDRINEWWSSVGKDDNDVILPATELFSELLRNGVQPNNINADLNCQSCPNIETDSAKPSVLTLLNYVKQMGDGTHADLTSIPKYVFQFNKSKPLQPVSQSAPNIIFQEIAVGDMYSEPNVLFDNLSKRLGIPYVRTLTSLDVSGNRISSTTGLVDLDNLKSLDISHNYLTTLSGIGKLPRLLEIKANVNLFRFLISNLETIAWAAPNLQTMDILPNPFQDLRDIQHLPQLITKSLPTLTRVDVWQAPFRFNSSIKDLYPTEMLESSLSHAIMVNKLTISCFCFNEMSSCCLLDLNAFPEHPPLPDGCENSGLDLDLSNNYLSSTCLTGSLFVFLGDWTNRLLKLQLQRNLLGDLRWMKDVIFPNLLILNLNDNLLLEVNELPQSCPVLEHLYLCHNPLRCDLEVINGLWSLLKLTILNCSESPLAQHPEYFVHVTRMFKNIKIIDGKDAGSRDTRCREETFVATGGITETTKVLEYFRDYDEMFALFSSMDVGLNYLRLRPTVIPPLLNLHTYSRAEGKVDGLSELPDLPVMSLHYDSPYLFAWPFCLDRAMQGYSHLPHNWSVKRIVKQFNPERKKARHILRAFSLSLGNDEYEDPVRLKLYAKDSYKKCPDLDIFIISPKDVPFIDQYDIPIMPTLREVIISYNCFIKNAHPGLLSPPTIYVLDSTRTQSQPDEPFVKYSSIHDLHLEHNQFSTLPQLPQLDRLHSMYSTYFKMQGMVGQDAHDSEAKPEPVIPEAIKEVQSIWKNNFEKDISFRESDLASEINKALLPIAVSIQSAVGKTCQCVQSDLQSKMIPTQSTNEDKDEVDESGEKCTMLKRCAPCNCLSLEIGDTKNDISDPNGI